LVVNANILSLIDLTSLNATDTSSSIISLCQKAVTPYGSVAAVCLYPAFVVQAASLLVDSGVKIATVANFPHGTDSIETTLQLIAQSIDYGANEIDVVMPYERYLAGEVAAVQDFVQHCKAACGDTVLLKIILETGALGESAVIARAARDMIDAGADFLKTSTGKIAIGATSDAVINMLFAIKESQKAVGLKVSGGVRTLQDALQYIALANRIMGAGWVTPRTFRLGASQLLDVVVASLG
jgi:deoxyribose-phosphate aldolase